MINGPSSNFLWKKAKQLHTHIIPGHNCAGPLLFLIEAYFNTVPECSQQDKNLSGRI